MSTKEKILNWYFSTHKIENKLGHDPYLDTSTIGKLSNALTSSRFLTTLATFAIASSISALAHDGTNNYAVLSGVVFGTFLETCYRARHIYEYNRKDSPEYYTDTNPDYEVTLPNESVVLRDLKKRFNNNHPKTIVNSALVYSAISSPFLAFHWEFAPFMVSAITSNAMYEAHSYWQARQILHRNWQLYTSLPDQKTQSQLNSKRNARATPAPTA